MLPPRISERGSLSQVRNVGSGICARRENSDWFTPNLAISWANQSPKWMLIPGSRIARRTAVPDRTAVRARRSNVMTSYHRDDTLSSGISMFRPKLSNCLAFCGMRQKVVEYQTDTEPWVSIWHVACHFIAHFGKCFACGVEGLQSRQCPAR